MKDYKLHTYTSLLFIVFFCIVSVISITFLTKNKTISILNYSINTLKNEASAMSNMTTELIALDLKKETITPLLQKAISNTEADLTFLSVIDWTGDYVCFPNITKIGQSASDENSIDYEDETDSVKLYEYLEEYDILSNKDSDNEIIKLHTVNNSDLLIACHLNTGEINSELKKFKTNAFITLAIIGFGLLLLLNALVRIISNYHNKKLDDRVLDLEFSAKNLTKLNETFSNYQEKLLSSKNEPTNTEPATIEETNENSSKERFLTYVRNELLSISTKDIAYIYVENTITYIIRNDGKLSTSNETLDKIYSTLDKKIFFKANRQFIISISCIKKITKFENSKLKLEVNPTSEINIVIGKNKASSFKQWLDL